MAYFAQIAVNYYESWDHRVKIIQEINQGFVDNELKQLTRFKVTMPELDQTTSWIKYPLSNSLYDELVKQVPSLKTEIVVLPFVETTCKHRNHDIICSAYLLRSGKLIKLYMPLVDTVSKFGLYRKKSIGFSVSDGQRIYALKPSDVAMILEE